MCKGYVYALLRLAIPNSPSIAEPNSQAAAGMGTADTEPPEKPLKALTAPAPVGSQAAVAQIPSPSVPPVVYKSTVPPALVRPLPTNCMEMP